MPQKHDIGWRKRQNRDKTNSPMERGDVLARDLWKRGVISIQTAGVILPSKGRTTDDAAHTKTN